ncbi:hypothetical protein NPE20_10435 [Mucilaginibacter sp. JC4]|uniref:Uncharacterized protein n=1 Tax=Mucilaginibacter aquariorum TaxID=2967225 RepID=A0ABT1T1A1_9SPHI|nr:hypothetical protein [Mucilaginibacter aquariorum]
MNNTTYRPQLAGPAKSSPEVNVVRLPVCSFGSAVAFVILQSSKDFIN